MRFSEKWISVINHVPFCESRTVPQGQLLSLFTINNWMLPCKNICGFFLGKKLLTWNNIYDVIISQRTFFPELCGQIRVHQGPSLSEVCQPNMLEIRCYTVGCITTQQIKGIGVTCCWSLEPRQTAHLFPLHGWLTWHWFQYALEYRAVSDWGAHGASLAMQLAMKRGRETVLLEQQHLTRSIFFLFSQASQNTADSARK